MNLALDYLPGSVTFDPVVQKIDPDLASRIVWFDAYTTNVDRTVRNTNMLMWHRQLWLIDHGASLYVHHSMGWENDTSRAADGFGLIKDHVLLRRAGSVAAVDQMLAELITSEVIDEIVSWIPDAWMATGEPGREAAPQRAAYARHLRDRLAAPRKFVEEAARVR